MQCAKQNVGTSLHYDKLVESVKEQKGTKSSICIAFKKQACKNKKNSFWAVAPLQKMFPTDWKSLFLGPW